MWKIYVKLIYQTWAWQSFLKVETRAYAYRHDFCFLVARGLMSILLNLFVGSKKKPQKVNKHKMQQKKMPNWLTGFLHTTSFCGETASVHFNYSKILRRCFLMSWQIKVPKGWELNSGENVGFSPRFKFYLYYYYFCFLFPFNLAIDFYKNKAF